MASPRGKKEASRALALGALVRKLRRERKETLGELAKRVPMSASNLSRLELGNQGPPADEAIERIAVALDADPDELLRSAGRVASGQSFEEQVLERLDALGREVRQVKDAVEPLRGACGSSRHSGGRS
jgi:transcriptional regulator with XRE-family HTH domain